MTVAAFARREPLARRATGVYNTIGTCSHTQDRTFWVVIEGLEKCSRRDDYESHFENIRLLIRAETCLDRLSEAAHRLVSSRRPLLGFISDTSSGC